MSLQRRILRGVLITSLLAGSSAGASAHTYKPRRLPLSSAIAMLVPPGAFIAYRGDVNVDEVVHVPSHGTSSQRLSDLLTEYGLQYSLTGNTYSIAKIGDQSLTPPSAAASSTPDQPSPFNSPGFTFTQVKLPPQKPTAIYVTSGLSPVAPVTDKPQNLMAAVNPVVPAVPVTVAKPLPPPPPPKPTWTLAEGTMVSKDLDQWAAVAGWQPVRWDFPKDFMVPATATVTGQFPDAVKQVITALRDQLQASDPDDANIHQDTYPDNRVIIINSITNETTANGS